jgi:hypothetical protein
MAMLAFGPAMLLLARRGSRLQAKKRLGTPLKSQVPAMLAATIDFQGLLRRLESGVTR